MSVTYTPETAAKLLHCSADQVRALIAAKRLSAVNTSLGRKRARWVISQAAIDAFLEGKVKPTKATRHRTTATSGKWF
jgi:excisionase family DNA binding protein